MSTYVSSIQTPSQTYYFPYDDHRWTIYGGFHPLVQKWRIPTDTARKVMADLSGLTGQAREVTIAFGEPAFPRHVYRVIVLGLEGSDNLQWKHILLTDVRWYLTYAWMILDANLRRRLGNKRLVGPNFIEGVPADNVAYAPWSINGDKAFTWTDLRDQVLNYLTTAKHGRPALAWTADSFHKIQVPTEAVQETTTDGDGSVGLARAIESIPGAGIYVDLAGMIHVYERVPGAEKDFLDNVKVVMPDLWGCGSMAFVDYSPVRPNNWLVYLDLEIEILLKYDPAATTAKDDPFLDPVLQVTDTLLTVDGQQVAAGTWITLEQAFKAWGGATYGTLVLPQLTDDIVANHWAGKGLDHYTVGNTFQSYDPAWGKRISELKSKYRTFFRINPIFWEKVRHAWAVRAAVWDPVTGTRAASPVFSNFAVMPVGALEMASINASAQVYFFGKNVTDSFPASGTLADGKPTGFGLMMPDEELGIVAISRSTDKFPGQQVVFPSPITGLAGLQNDGAALSDGNLQQLWHTSGANSWKLMTVISVAPASPNDLRRCYQCKVSLADAAAAAGLTATPSAGGAPDKESRTQVGSARIPWIDGQCDQILLMISGQTGINNNDSIATVDPINLESEVRPLSKATAAQELMAVLDRYEGRVAIPFSPSVVPLGSIQRVTHRISDNALMTEIEANGDEPPFNAVDFLHGAARSYLLKEIASAR